MNAETTLFRALADPSRRRILDLLRQRPRTTAELTASFAFSRYAVMKHLKVLERAGLVSVRREGRRRWNHLNAVPLQAVVARWVRPFEAAGADRLLRLQAVVEGEAPPPPSRRPAGPSRQGDAMSSLDIADAVRSVQIQQEIELSAPPERVFDALVGDITPWWGRPHVRDPERVVSIEIEPFPGGRFLESWGENEGAVWAHVTQLDRNRRLTLRGPMAMGGAVTAVMEFRLEPHDHGTRLRFTHFVVGQIDEETAQGYEAGWQRLLGRQLKAWVERGERMGLGHEAGAEA